LCLSQDKTWIFSVIFRGLFLAQWIKMKHKCSFRWYLVELMTITFKFLIIR
jgi:hypothetical protein